jgi:hypothetical protein
MKIAKLVCRHCGSNLSGLSQDRLFFCSSCGKGWVVASEGLLEVEVQCRASSNSHLPLPFWMVRATVHVLKRTVRNEFTSTIIRFGSRYEEDVLAAKKTETGGFSERRTFLFPAFPMDGLPGTGVALSREVGNIPNEAEPGDALPDVCGGSVSEQDAAVLARCIAAGQETEKSDWLAEIEIVLSSVKSTLVVLPCSLEVEKVYVADTGVSFFRRSVADWDRIMDYYSSRT